MPRAFNWVAIAVIGLVCAGCAGDPETRKQQYLESGNRYFDQERYREAIIEYLNAIRIDARLGEAHSKLAQAYVHEGDVARAVQEFVRAADVLPDDIDAQLTAGEYLLLAGRSDDARARAEAALALDPSNIPALILQGNALAGLQEFESAIVKIEEAIELDPERSESYASLGVIQAVRGRGEEAEAAFEQAVELDGSSVQARLALASFYWAARRLAEADASFAAARKLAPEDLLVNRALAAFTMATGRTGETEQYLQTIASVSPSPGAELALADYYLATTRPDDAIERLEPLAADPSVAAAAQYRLARAHLALGEALKARELVDQLLDRMPAHADALLLKAELLVADGDRGEALNQVRAAVAADPNMVRAHFALGRLFAMRGDGDAAEQSFNEVLRLNPRATAAEIELSKLHLVGGRADASVRFAEEAVNREPGNVQARLALVRGLLASRNLERADAELVDLRSTNPRSASVLALSGMLAAARQDPVAARQAYEHALELDAESFEALSGLVVLDVANRDFPAAKARVDRRLALAPDRPDLLLLAARTSAASGDVGQAERLLRRAIERDPTLLPAYSMLAQIYVRQHKLEEAAAEFEALAERQSRPVAALTMAGIIHQGQGNDEIAVQRYERVLGIDPRAGVAANNLAWIRAESGGNLDVALQLAQTAAAAMPSSPEAHDTLGWIYYKKNLPAQAITALSESARLDPQNAVYQYRLGLAYEQAGDAPAARLALERALALDASFDGARDARRILGEISTLADTAATR